MTASRPTPCAGVVCFRGDDVLLVQRGRPPRKGEWSIPGGKIDKGERSIAAALRELKEETSVSAKIVSLIDVVDSIVPAKDGEPELHYVLIDYAAVWENGEPRAGDDAAEARFVPIDEAYELVSWEETRRIIRKGRELVDRRGENADD